MTRTPLPPPLDSATRDRLLSEISGHPEADALASLVYDVMSRQAEGKVLFAGAEVVRTRALGHNVTRESSETSFGNVLGILERGADSDLERALLSALTVRGFALRAGKEDDSDSLLQRFCRHLIWFATATSFSLHAFLDEILPAELAPRVWKGLAEDAVGEADPAVGATPQARARNAARVSLLAQSNAESAREALTWLSAHPRIDPGTAALARALGGTSGLAMERATVRGRAAPPARPFGLRVLRWVSAWSLLSWLGRAVLSLLGTFTEVALTLEGDQIAVRRRRFFLGKPRRDSYERFRLNAVKRAAREARYGAMRSTIGACSLGLGVLLGGILCLDGARTSELTVMLVGAIVLAAGAGLDLGLDLWPSSSRARVGVDLVAEGGASLRISGVPLEDADRFLDQLRAE